MAEIPRSFHAPRMTILGFSAAYAKHTSIETVVIETVVLAAKI